MRTLRRSLIVAVSSAVLVSGLPVAPVSAVVEPRTCKTIRHAGKRFLVKADQIRCAKAEDHVRRYLKTRRAPRHFKCRWSSKGPLALTCDNTRASPDEQFRAIRR